VRHDLVLSGFAAELPDLVAAAVAAERAGFDGVWVFDHFAGGMLARPWSRDPFVSLGAIAASTQRITLGVLVANIANRHPAQLASAANSVQSLAPGRFVLGLGAGAAPGSRFAGEADAIGRPVASNDVRRAQLAETIACLRAIWDGDAFHGEHYQVAADAGIVDGAERPPIVVGASGIDTVRLAAQIADGVNIRDGARLAELVAAAGPTDVSVFTAFDLEHPTGGDIERLAQLGVAGRTMFASPPFTHDALDAITRIGAAIGDRNAPRLH